MSTHLQHPSEAMPEVVIREGNCGLKQVLGATAGIADLIDEKKISSCQALIDDAAAQFFTTSASQFQALNEAAERLAVSQALEPGDAAFEGAAYEIMGKAGMLGFTFIALVCSELIAVGNSKKLNPGKKYRVSLKLIQALQHCYAQRSEEQANASNFDLLAHIEAEL